MKIKNVILSAAFTATLFCTGSARAQISYSEDFEGTLDWDNPDSVYYQEAGCSDTSFLTGLYSGYAGFDLTTVSPSIGLSNGGVATLTYDYKLVLFSTGLPLENTPDWGSVKVEYATSDQGPWTAVDIITPENHTPSASCAPRIAQFTPLAGNTIYLRLNVRVNDEEPSIDAIVYFDDLTVEQAEPCATPVPANLAATQAVCINANIGDLNIGDYNTIVWYSDAVGGAPLASSVTITNGTTYYAANFEECESIGRTPVAVTVNVVEVPGAAPEQIFCSSATVSDLQVEDVQAQVLWYAAVTEGSPLAGTASLDDGTTYYVSQLIEGCESERTPVNVVITTSAMPGVISPQVFEDNQPVTVMLYDIEVEATGTVTWYATQEDAIAGTDALPETTELTEGGTYYVTQTILGCESAPASVVIDILLGTDIFHKNAISFYPNPVKDIFTLTSDLPIHSVTIYSLLGQELIHKIIHENDPMIDMAQFSNGTYLVEVKSDDHTDTIRIVKH